VFIRYPPARIRYEGDQPAALLGVRVAPSYRLVDLPPGSPTTSHRAGPEVHKDPIRLKNLLRQATDALQADGVRAPMLHSVLAPPRRLVNDGLFGQHQSDGLALYSRPGWCRSLRVPLDLPELAVVAERFPHQPPAAAVDRRRPVPRAGPQPEPDPAAGGNPEPAGEGRPARVPLGVRDALQGQEAEKQLQLWARCRGTGAPRRSSATRPGTCAGSDRTLKEVSR
jgi:hypothetical protein